jgi:hypothetical protein
MSTTFRVTVSLEETRRWAREQDRSKYHWEYSGSGLVSSRSNK